MSIDPGRSGRIECTLHNDRRLIAGAAALAAHVARHAGLSERAQQDLDEAVTEACREAFQLSGGARRTGATIHLTVGSYPDRVEVAVEYPDGKSAAGRPASRRSGAAAGESARGHLPAAGLPVDHIERATLEGRCRMTLVMYSGAAKSSSRT